MPLDKKFKCYEHYYSCDTPQVWEWHITDEAHTHQGMMNIRGQDMSFVWTGKVPKGLKAHEHIRKMLT